MPDADSLVAIHFRFGLVDGWGRILHGNLGVRMVDSRLERIPFQCRVARASNCSV